MSWNVKVSGNNKNEAMDAFANDPGKAHVPESVKTFIDEAVAGLPEDKGVEITTYGHLSGGTNGMGASNATIVVGSFEKV